MQIGADNDFAIEKVYNANNFFNVLSVLVENCTRFSIKIEEVMHTYNT